jgi:hypothetical protein
MTSRRRRTGSQRPDSAEVLVDGLAEGLAEPAVQRALLRVPQLSRRSLLTGAAVIGGTALWSTRRAAAATRAVTGSAAPVGAAATVAGTDGKWQHAIGNPRGSDIAVKVGRTAEGRFGVMFKKAPAFAPPDELLHDLAVSMVDDRVPGQDPSNHDAQDNPAITGGYTFLGQFIDHDMTRDTTPLTLQEQDPKGTTNYDTPFLDLQSVYGNGPAADPQLYESDGVHLKITSSKGIPDLPRDAAGHALLGDPRNDENLVLAQLHVGFLAFHNRLIDEGRSFTEARKLTRWHFQWLIVNEFLPRVCGRALMDSYLSVPPSQVRPRFYTARNPSKPFMPIEYSVGAYRFGHSMIRSEYEMNDAHTRPTFGQEGFDLRGSRPVPAELQADWSYFFDVPGMEQPDGLNLARRIDANLAIPLHDLPDTVVPRDITPAFTDLAERNLLRGKRLGLPAGQDVAKAMGLPPLTNAALGLTDTRWGGKAPLWFYVLKEAELQHGGSHLGAVGGRIVAETILAFLVLDKTSYFWASPTFTPLSSPFTVGAFLKYSRTGKRMPQQ